MNIREVKAIVPEEEIGQHQIQDAKEYLALAQKNQGKVRNLYVGYAITCLTREPEEPK